MGSLLIVSFPVEHGNRTISCRIGDLFDGLSENPDVRLNYKGMIGGVLHFSVSGSLRGGKGGFGKLLRSQKNIGKRTDNFDSARDLSGRRIRVAKKDELIETWKEKKAKEEQQSSSSSAIKEPTPAVTLDEKYIAQLASIEESKLSAISVGLKQSTPAPSQPTTKKLLRFDDDSD